MANVDRGHYRNLTADYDAKQSRRRLVRRYGISRFEQNDVLFRTHIKRRRDKRYIFRTLGRRRVGVVA